MPQPKNTQTADVVVPSLDAVLSEGESVVIQRIQNAVNLLKDQRDIQKDIGANRNSLRIFESEGMLTDAQREWLNAWYPKKTKGDRRSDEEISKTKKVRASALGVSESEVSDGE